MKASTGTCAVCHTPQPMLRGTRVREHCVLVQRQFDDVQVRCDGSERPPLEKRTKARERAKAKRERHVASVRDEALVVLDAVSEQTQDVEQLFPGRLWVLRNLALTAYRLRWPKSRVEWPFRWVKRGESRTMFAPKVGDLYCIFCGELLVAPFERQALTFLRGLSKTSLPHLRELGDRVWIHTTICGLQCLAGMREYVSPDTRRLPHDVTEAA